jgi:hypothetical protein
MINHVAIRNECEELVMTNIGNQINECTINKIGFDAAQIMYKHGFNDNFAAMPELVVPGINLRVQSNGLKLSLAFRSIDTGWTEIQARENC